jgi:hypothetical protein
MAAESAHNLIDAARKRRIYPGKYARAVPRLAGSAAEATRMLPASSADDARRAQAAVKHVTLLRLYADGGRWVATSRPIVHSPCDRLASLFAIAFATASSGGLALNPNFWMRRGSAIKSVFRYVVWSGNWIRMNSRWSHHRPAVAILALKPQRVLDPFCFLLIAVSGWMNQRQLQVIDYLVMSENSIALKTQSYAGDSEGRYAGVKSRF